METEGTAAMSSSTPLRTLTTSSSMLRKESPRPDKAAKGEHTCGITSRAGRAAGRVALPPWNGRPGWDPSCTDHAPKAMQPQAHQVAASQAPAPTWYSTRCASSSSEREPWPAAACAPLSQSAEVAPPARRAGA